jgi:hypothetical protein
MVPTSSVPHPAAGRPADLPLFVFGSLRDDDLLEAVLGGSAAHLPMEPAELDGFRCRRAEGGIFPILVPEPQAVGAAAAVPGRLLHGLAAAEFDRILFYEGEGYALRPLAVGQGAARRRTMARAFLATGKMRDSGETWDLAAWTARDKPLALARTRALMTRYDGSAAPDSGGPSRDVRGRSPWERRTWML